MEQLPNPLTGQLFDSPVPPGTGWPGDPATLETSIAATPAGVRRLARQAVTLDELDAVVSVCRACPRLVAWREEVAESKRKSFADQPYWGRPVPSFGDSSARLLVLGLAPAAHGANRTGRMFTGDRSGDWIFAGLHRAGLATQATSVYAGDGQELLGVRMVAPVHCAPPANAPTTTEKATCSGWLDRELALLTEVGAILALGGIAWQAAHTTAVRLGWKVPKPRTPFGHGATSTFTRPDGREITLVGCYHVSQQNTFTGRLTESMLDAVIQEAWECAHHTSSGHPHTLDR